MLGKRKSSNTVEKDNPKILRSSKPIPPEKQDDIIGSDDIKNFENKVVNIGGDTEIIIRKITDENELKNFKEDTIVMSKSRLSCGKIPTEVVVIRKYGRKDDDPIVFNTELGGGLSEDTDNKYDFVLSGVSSDIGNLKYKKQITEIVAKLSREDTDMSFKLKIGEDLTKEILGLYLGRFNRHTKKTIWRYLLSCAVINNDVNLFRKLFEVADFFSARQYGHFLLQIYKHCDKYEEIIKCYEELMRKYKTEQKIPNIVNV